MSTLINLAHPRMLSVVSLLQPRLTANNRNPVIGDGLDHRRRSLLADPPPCISAPLASCHAAERGDAGHSRAYYVRSIIVRSEAVRRLAMNHAVPESWPRLGNWRDDSRCAPDTDSPGHNNGAVRFMRTHFIHVIGARSGGECELTSTMLLPVLPHLSLFLSLPLKTLHKHCCAHPSRTPRQAFTDFSNEPLRRLSLARFRLFLCLLFSLPIPQLKTRAS